MSAAHNNCAVLAVAAVTGEARQDIAAGIARFPTYHGGPAFTGDAVNMWSVGTYLESRGWEVLVCLDRPAIPWTCIIAAQNPDHCFAIINGRIHDRAAVRLDGAEIHFIFVPPAERECERGSGAT
jgi:hypothetical protein